MRYRCSQRDCPRAGDPTLTARAEFAQGFPHLWLRDVVLHSTSWRYEEDGPDSVAAHAVRHLAFLIREDPEQFRNKLRAETIAALMKVAPDVAGRHDLKGAA